MLFGKPFRSHEFPEFPSSQGNQGTQMYVRSPYIIGSSVKLGGLSILVCFRSIRTCCGLIGLHELHPLTTTMTLRLFDIDQQVCSIHCCSLLIRSLPNPQLTFYGAYHANRVNILVHIICVPVLLW